MLAEVKLKEDTGMAGGRPAGSPPQTECRTHRPTDCDTTAVEHSTRGSTDIATGKSAPRPNPEAITCPTAEQMDMELDLKHELVELNRTRDDSKQSMQERLYNLHTLMAGTGRAGKLTPFLRDELKWPEKHAYDKAMRWIAAYELRAGLIDEETYRKRMGNGNTTSRSDSPATPDRPVAPPLHQTFTVEVSDDEVELAAPIFTSVEIATDALALEKRKQSFYSPVLMRAYYPVGLAAWRASLACGRAP